MASKSARCALFIREPLLDWTTEFGGHRLGVAMAAMDAHCIRTELTTNYL